ncbi:hypothetical protein D9M72_626230 [compost metagenome]
MVPGDDQLALGQLVLDQVARHQGYAATGLGGADAHVERIETRAVVAVLRMQVLFEKPFMPGLGPRGALQQHLLGQFLGAAQWPTLQQFRRADRDHVFTEQLDTGCTGPGPLAEEKHHIRLGLQ